MAYPLRLVHLSETAYTLNAPNNLLGFPAAFNYLLFSAWICLGQDGNSRVVQWTNSAIMFDITINLTGVEVVLTAGLVPGVWFDGTFAHSFVGPVTNVQVSVNALTGLVQCYANDVALTLTTGGATGAPSPFSINTTWCNWLLDGEAAASPGSGVADLYMAAPTSFYDLSVTANRRRFQNADLSPVDIGFTGSAPLGVSPAVYLTARSGTASNLAVNNGTGGSLNIHTGITVTFLPDGSCTIPWPDGGDGVVTTLTDSELFFSPAAASFVDLSIEAARRLFVTASTTPQFLGPSGEIPLGTRPVVYLTTQGVPTEFAQNNGTGGSFAITQPVYAATGPGCTPYYVTEPAGPAADPQWRLTVSDDGGRTWSTLVKPRSSGKLGEYLSRLRWQKMGQSRERMIKLECTDPVRRNIVGVYLDLKEGLS